MKVRTTLMMIGWMSRSKIAKVAAFSVHCKACRRTSWVVGRSHIPRLIAFTVSFGADESRRSFVNS